MNEKRLDKIEDMLATLITMVENMNNQLITMDGRLNTMDGRLSTMENRLNTMDGRLKTMEDGQNDMRAEIMAKQKDMQADQNFIWEKVARNERELAKLRSHLRL